ncbi:MAG: hypothetical protein AAFR61_21815 [Bacteroidota bacterium]
MADTHQSGTNIDFKTFFSLMLMAAGLIVAIWGWVKWGPEEVTQTFNGIEMTLRNGEASQSYNWLSFFGLGGFFTGLLLLFFPNQRTILKGTGVFEE